MSLQLSLHPTPAQVQAAKDARDAERQAVYEASGVRVWPDGRIRVDRDHFWAMQRLADYACAAIYGARGEWRK